MATVKGFKVGNDTLLYQDRNLVNEFSTSNLYKVGDYVINPDDGKLYKCTVDIEAGGTWDNTKWVEVRIGDEVNDLKSAVSAVMIEVNDPSFWAQGGISSSTGNYSSSTTRIRTITQLPETAIKVTPKSGYKYIIAAYNNGTYVGCYNGSTFPQSATWLTEETNLKEIGNYSYSIVLAKTNDAAITPADAINLVITMNEQYIENEIEAISGTVKAVVSSDYSKLDGGVNNAGIISDLSTRFHTSPIAVSAYATVYVYVMYPSNLSIAETDSEGSRYRYISDVVNNPLKYTPLTDTYISVSYAKSDNNGISAIVIKNASPAEVKASNYAKELVLGDNTSDIVQSTTNRRLDADYAAQDEIHFNQAIADHYKMIAEVKQLGSSHILTSGSCGYTDNGGTITDGTITWELYDNGILYISGYGKMYDYIKGICGCKNSAEVYDYIEYLKQLHGNTFWYYGFIEPNANGFTNPIPTTEYKYETNEVMVYTTKRYAPNGENTNPINSLPYGYGAPWYIYRNEVSFGDGLFPKDDSGTTAYTNHAEYNRQNPNGWVYDRVCIDEDLSHGGITYIGDWAFYRCCVDSLVLPTQVTHIGCWCVRYSPVMRTLVMYDAVTDIEDYGVSRMLSLRHLRLSNSLVTSSYGTFNANEQLAHIDFPASFVTAGSALLQGDNSLEKVDFGGVTVLPWHVAGPCNNIDRVILPEGVTSIGDYAFVMTSLNNITIPDTVTTIGSNAFANVEKDVVTIESNTISASCDSFTANGHLLWHAKEVRIPVGNTISDFIFRTFKFFAVVDGYMVYKR